MSTIEQLEKLASTAANGNNHQLSAAYTIEASRRRGEEYKLSAITNLVIGLAVGYVVLKVASIVCSATLAATAELLCPEDKKKK